ncbi:MAG: hypothetical protein OCD00_03115 [Colwellia sp.]
MELLPILKQLAEIGISAPVIIGVYGLLRLNHLIAGFDKRLAVVEAKIEKAA